MPDRKDKENGNLLSAVEAAVAIGATAAFLSQSINPSRLLGEGGVKIDKVLSGLKEDFLGKTSKDIDYTFLKNTMNKHFLDSDSTIKTASAITEKINFEKHAQNNLVGHINKALENIYNQYDNLGEIYKANYNTKTIGKIAKNFDGDNSKIQAINRLVTKTFQDPQDMLSLDDNYNIIFNEDSFEKVTKKIFNPEESNKVMQELLTAYKEKDEGLSSFVDNNSNISNSLYDAMMNLDDLKKKFGKENFQYDVATVNDIIKNKERFTNTSLVFKNDNSNTTVNKDIIDLLEGYVNDNPEFGDLIVDSTIKMSKDGNLYSTSIANKTFKNVADEFANTLPGKLTKTRDILMAKDAPSFYHFKKGSRNPILAGKVGEEGSVLKDNFFFINSKIYKLDNDNNIQLLEGVEGGYLQSGRHGLTARTLKSMAGDGDFKPQTGIKDKLDINTSGAPTNKDEFLSIFKKFNDPMWARKILEDLSGPGLNTEDKKNIDNSYERLVSLNTFFKNTVDKIDENSVQKLSKVSTGKTKDLFDLVNLNDEELIEQLLKYDPENFINKDLGSFIKNYRTDSSKIMNTKKIYNNKDTIINSTKVTTQLEQVKQEIVKEAFLEEASVTNSLDSISSLIHRADLKGNQKHKIDYIAGWAAFQNQTSMYLSTSKKLKPSTGFNSKETAIMAAEMMFKTTIQESNESMNQHFLSQFRTNMDRMIREKAPATQKGLQRLELENDILEGFNYGEYVYMQKAVSPLTAINDSTKRKAFVNQWTAGRKNMKDVTTATLFPYFGVSRLVDPLASLGLNFSERNTGNVLDLVKAIGLKRILPIAGALTTVSYLDYEMKNFTGTSLRGAFASGLGNVDLGLRKISDKIGLGNIIETERQLNPITQYWFGEHQTAEERKEWYEEGYSPVRKGRFWSFGSTSEFRGGKIDYFQPNFVKRANSDWHDIGVYGSTEDKWKHSFIPTPRHPFSTIRRLADPYWLEDKQKEDRPYPVSGKLFTEGTPWGAVLNPTIGQLLKPQKRMHQDRLGNTLVDVKDLIAQRNEATIKKAINNNDLIRVQEGNFETVSFSPYSQTTPFDFVMNYQVNKNGVVNNNANLNYEGVDPNNYKEIQDAYRANYKTIKSTSKDINSLSVLDSVKYSSASGNIFSSLISDTVSYNNYATISEINNQTINKASNQPKGIITADAIFKTKAKNSRELLYNKELAADLRNITSTSQSIHDLMYSAKELGGMYGFLIDEIVPGKNRNRFEQAGTMTSFSRKFWDMNIGGFGGEFMEIARRFFPHEDHSIQGINPIRNSQEEWMPRMFKTGDPYAKIPKGEMRLPGKGYEDLYKLHPDQFGEYGAFDRMKILADVAPWSSEYKTWRDIASKTVQDKELKEEMKNIRRRVTDQSKQHDFYSQRFLGRGTKETNVVIDEVLSGNTFTVLGSQDIYKLAGIESVEEIENYITPGMHFRLKEDENESYRTNEDGSVNAILLNKGGNLNRELLDKKVATEREDSTAVGAQAKATVAQAQRGALYELLAHADIPYIHNKFMRIETPIESFKNTQIYGSNYSTWSKPFEGFIRPAFQQAWAVGPLGQTIGVASWALAEKVFKETADSTRGKKILAGALLALTNKGALAGGIMGGLPKLGFGEGTGVKLGARIGATVGLAGYAVKTLDNPLESAFAFGALGAKVGDQLFHSPLKGAAIGATAALAISGYGYGLFDKNKNTTYIPKNVEKRWEVEEYFDRLKYVKYMGLYKKAARKAKSKEKVDIEKIINKEEYDEINRAKLRENLLSKQEKIRNTYGVQDGKKEQLILELDQKIASIYSPTQILEAGEYTKSALAYKQAAESTIYGLQKDATWAQILRAVPKNYRDYVLEFAKERDPKKRKEIEKYFSPYVKRALDVAWGEKPRDVENNFNYFKGKKLPGFTWRGWNPYVDIEDIQIKTINNEGMMLSDFGFYDSSLSDPEVMQAEAINYENGTSSINLMSNLTTALSGAGLFGVDVSIEPSNAQGVQMIANIARIGTYKVKEGINGVLGKIFY